MRVGILTYHRSHNYGALLQAIALRVVLQSMGHDVFYVDYFPAYHKRVYALFDWNEFYALPTFKKRIKYCLRKGKTLIPKLIRKQRFDRFISRHINPYCLPEKASFDLMLYGSDQIWRKQPFLGQYNPMYFGENSLSACRHVSYAASLSCLPSNEEDVSCFLYLVKHLDAISVREESTRVFLNNNGIPNVRVDLDPVLLLRPLEWLRLFPDKVLIQGRYVLLYDLQANAFCKVFNEQEVSAFAENNRCKLIKIRGGATKIGSEFDRHLDDPESFINLIKHADCVVTSSYHGLVFSLLFCRPVICRFSQNSERAKSLLQSLDAEHLLLHNDMKIPPMIQPFDIKVENRIESLRHSSLDYLKGLSSLIS